jgi:hypothetical protein
MNKVYVLPPKEDWIVDRFVKEWNEDNADISVYHPKDAHVVWLLADWCWEGLSNAGLLRYKKVITTVHHITPEKFGFKELDDFRQRDLVTTAYHVYNERTHSFIRPLTEKPIHLIKYWANQKIWLPTLDKGLLRQKYGIPTDAYVIGSFQRDTEGKDLKSPKLEKGPDLLADFIIRKHRQRGIIGDDKVHVVLAGWRRQYLIGRLEEAGVPYTYLERPPHETVNELYQTLDLYPVTARHEGGPQSLIECGLLNVPVVSRPVGIAEQVLPSSAIADDVFNATPAIPNVEAWKLPAGYEPYRKLIESL